MIIHLPGREGEMIIPSVCPPLTAGLMISSALGTAANGTDFISKGASEGLMLYCCRALSRLGTDT